MTARFEMIIQLAPLVILVAGVIFGILEICRPRKARAERAAIDVFSVTVQEVFIDTRMAIRLLYIL